MVRCSGQVVPRTLYMIAKSSTTNEVTRMIANAVLADL